MKPYACWAFLALPVLVPGPASPQDSRVNVPSPAPVRLRTGSAVTVAGGTFGHFVGPLQCDPDGNVFFVPAPPFPSPPAPPAVTPPDAAVRVSADGKTTTRFSLTSVPGLGNFADSQITATAFDTGGNLYVLAVGGSRQYIVSFTKSGQYKSKIEIDLHEIMIGSFAVFNSGEFLLAGRPPDDPMRPRVAVLSAGGGSLWDVALSADPALKKGLPVESRMELLDLASAEPAPDGRVYFARRTPRGPVYAVSPSGVVTGKFALVPPRRGATLFSIKVSGHRLAAVYAGAPASDDGSSVYWVAVHDLSTGEHLASYGPVTRFVLCYRSGEGPDRFTLLSMKADEMQLLDASAP